MVRLKERDVSKALLIQTDFNSIVVRLKVTGANGFLKYLTIFQFHCGAIKRAFNVSCYFFYTIFQFHCGAIKSKKRIYDLRQEKNFNSIVVRLKDLMPLYP